MTHPECQITLPLNYTDLSYSLYKYLPLGVLKSIDIPWPMLRRNVSVPINTSFPLVLGPAVMTDIDRNELMVTVHQGKKCVGTILLASITDGKEHLLNHLLGKPFPELPLKIKL